MHICTYANCLHFSICAALFKAPTLIYIYIYTHYDLMHVASKGCPTPSLSTLHNTSFQYVFIPRYLFRPAHGRCSIYGIASAGRCTRGLFQRALHPRFARPQQSGVGGGRQSRVPSQSRRTEAAVHCFQPCRCSE